MRHLGFALRLIARQGVERLKVDFAGALRSLDLDHRIQGDKRHAEVGGMDGDAMLAPAEHGVETILALERITPRARNAPVTGARRILEIGAAGSLHQVAADRGGVAKLRRRAGEQGFGDRRKGPQEALVVSKVGIADKGSDPDIAVRQPVDSAQAWHAADVDDPVRPCDTNFHQIE